MAGAASQQAASSDITVEAETTPTASTTDAMSKPNPDLRRHVIAIYKGQATILTA